MILSGILEAALKVAIIGVVGVIAGWNASNTLRVKPLQHEFDTFKFAVNSKGAKQEVRVELVEVEIVREVETGRKEDAKKIGDLDLRLRVALNELRLERNRTSKLKDPNTAPAECRDYGADPRELSLPHAEFLVRDASRAERIVVQRDACIRDYGIVKAKLDALAAEKAKERGN